MSEHDEMHSFDLRCSEKKHSREMVAKDRQFNLDKKLIIKKHHNELSIMSKGLKVQSLTAVLLPCDRLRLAYH